MEDCERLPPAMDCLSCDHKFGSHAVNGCRTSSSDVSTQRVQITTVTSRSAILAACVVCADAEEGDVRQGDSLFSLLIPFESSFMFLRIWTYLGVFLAAVVQQLSMPSCFA